MNAPDWEQSVRTLPLFVEIKSLIPLGPNRSIAATLGMPTLLPSNMIHELLDIPPTDYPVLGIPAWLLITVVTNGVVCGFAIWLFFSLVNLAARRQPEVSIDRYLQDQSFRMSP